MSPEELMLVAVDAARRGLAAGQTPFGCAIARDGKVLAACHNTVWLTKDATAHAEVNAVREACRRTGQVSLDEVLVATTCEPCPMCAAALHWARVGTIYFGASIADATAAGFHELAWPAAEILSRSSPPIAIHGNCLADTCRALFQDWQASGRSLAY